jgi:diaminopimelate epimerase
VHLSKHHGLGNDFLVVLDERNPGLRAEGPAGRADAADTAAAADPDAVLVGASLARRLCDRRRGLGADGLIHGARPDAAQQADGIDVVMHLFNSDGSRAEISGNGIRCLAQAVARARGVDRGTFRAWTDAGIRTLTVLGPCDTPTPGSDGAGEDEGAEGEGDCLQVRVEMGVVGPGPHVPVPVEELLAGRHGTADVGNPHLVVLVDDPESVDLAVDGAWLEQQFPGGVNVEYVKVRDRGNVELRVWERGAGITEACGSGACAAVAVTHRLGLVDAAARVVMPGGAASVELSADGSAALTGPTVHVADTQVDLTPDRASRPAPEPAPVP